MTAAAPTALQVAELRSLVTGREGPDVVDRLGAVVDRLAAGEPIADDDRVLLARVLHEYGHELAELTDPEG